MIEKAVEKFHEAVTAENYAAITTVWTVGEGTNPHINFTSGLLGRESFEWAIAGAIKKASEDYEVDAEAMADAILEDVVTLNDAEEYVEDNFENAVENLKGIIDCYERFRRDSIPNTKTFYSDFEEEAYNKYYAKTCEEYETDIAKAARKLAELKGEI
ncbi:MAG: hypothetical protein IKZ58_06425 [Selenomonadaceae bacterium]|nr:hypothetical protein [Selenomonadaceae bacterium]